MTTIEDKIRELRGAISAAQGAKTRAAVEMENSKSRLADARAVLLNEFGVSTTEEAKAKLAELRAELDAAVADIETQLTEAGA